MIVATRDYECELLTRYSLIAGVDEVGRGSLAGPVTVGICVIDRKTGAAPEGLADSKLVRPSYRQTMANAVKTWAVDTQVASSSAQEIDEVGIICALRRAGMRALDSLAQRGIVPDIVLLDGNHDWLTSPNSRGLWGDPEDDWPDLSCPVITRVKADRDCAVVAGASLVAKVHRDAYMAALPDPGYQWAANKGYASPAHMAALVSLGPSDYHRRSWKLPARAESKEQ